MTGAPASALAPTRTKLIPVVEIFGPTIQGEGAEAGVPTHFVRVGGCDFRCALVRHDVRRRSRGRSRDRREAQQRRDRQRASAA